MAQSPVALITLTLFAGCAEPAPQEPPPTPLYSAEQALQSNQPDAAIADADAYLRQFPHGQHAARAYFLKGFGYEHKLNMNPSDMQSNLTAARTNYLLALQEKPDESVARDIHAGLSNVAFYQDDFAAAITEGANAADLGADPRMQAGLLYRTAVSQERLGRFTDADMTYRQIQQKFPNTPEAAMSRQEEGRHLFYLQLETLHTASAADKEKDALRLSGLLPADVILSTRTEPTGDTTLTAGPFNSYAAAKATKDMLGKRYPVAIVIP